MSLQGRWRRFWSEREARKRASLIAAGRAAVERYTPCAQLRETACRGAPAASTDRSLELRKDPNA